MNITEIAQYGLWLIPIVFLGIGGFVFVGMYRENLATKKEQQEKRKLQPDYVEPVEEKNKFKSVGKRKHRALIVDGNKKTKMSTENMANNVFGNTKFNPTGNTTATAENVNKNLDSLGVSTVNPFRDTVDESLLNSMKPETITQPSAPADETPMFPAVPKKSSSLTGVPSLPKISKPTQTPSTVSPNPFLAEPKTVNGIAPPPKVVTETPSNSPQFVSNTNDEKPRSVKKPLLPPPPSFKS